jgi:phosphorylcholine metabolism protein LicD
MRDENFLDTILILNKNKVDYWVCHGTLLGLIREGKLIEWDNDIDIGVLKNKKNIKLINQIFKKKGFKRKKKFFSDDGLLTFTREGGREVDINFYELFLNKKVNKKFVICKWYVPKNIFCKIVDAISNASSYDGKFKHIIRNIFFLEKIFNKIKIFLIKKNIFYSKLGYSHPLDLILKKKIVYFFKIKALIPNNPKIYLKYIYGKNWKVPKRNYVWYKDSPSLSSK